MAKTIYAVLTRTLRDDDAATLVEYAMVTGLIAAACFTILTALTADLIAFFGSLDTLIDSTLP